MEKNTDEYDIWYHMLMRCYDPKYQEKEPAYKGCIVENYLLNFQNMGKWIEENYYNEYVQKSNYTLENIHQYHNFFYTLLSPFCYQNY